MNLDSLRSLQQRLRVASGADRELDARIICALSAPKTAYVEQSHINGAWVIFDGHDRKGKKKLWEPPASLASRSYVYPPFTTYPDGLGVCVGLMTAVLPGAMWEKRGREFRVYPFRVGLTWPDHYLGQVRANDCLTFLDAIFSAVISQLEAQEKADV